MGDGGAGASSAAFRVAIRVLVLAVIAGVALGVDAVVDRSADHGSAVSAARSSTSGTPAPSPLWRANHFIETASGGAEGRAWVRLRQQQTGALVRITFAPERGLQVHPLNDPLARVVQSGPMSDGARALVSVQSGH